MSTYCGVVHAVSNKVSVAGSLQKNVVILNNSVSTVGSLRTSVVTLISRLSMAGSLLKCCMIEQGEHGKLTAED